MDRQAVILVTGGAGDLGASVVEHFATQGFGVVINYSRSEERAMDLRETIATRHGKSSVLIAQADVGRREDVRRMFDSAIEAFGHVDVLVNMAGINRDKPFLELTDEDWNAVISTNLTGTFMCSQEFALRYKGQDGQIINIGALTAIRGRRNGANYCSSRAAIVNLTKCLALELAPTIRVNTVTPGWIATREVVERYKLRDEEVLSRSMGMIPLGRLGEAADVTRTIDFLVRKATYITGQNFLVDGGFLMY